MGLGSAPSALRWVGRLLATSLILLASGAASLSAEEPLLVLYAERAPYMSSSGREVSGLTADVAAYALRRAGIPFRWVPVPSARQLVMIQENKERLAGLGWFRNPEREKFAKFSSAIYQDKRIAVLARRDNPRVVAARTLGELLGDRNLVLLAKLAYSYGKFLDDQITAFKPVTTKVTVENLSMIQMIFASRADYMFISPEEADVAIRLSGIPATSLTLITLSDMPPGEKRYLMFSKQVDDDTIKRIDHYIHAYHAARK